MEIDTGYVREHSTTEVTKPEITAIYRHTGTSEGHLQSTRSDL